MKVKNKNVYVFGIIIFIWNILTYYLKGITNYNHIINYIFWLITLIFCIINFKKEYKRDKYKSIIFKDIIIFVLLYIIIYYLLGIVVSFKKSPLSFNLYNIIKNLINYVLLKGIIESTKYYLIKENNSKLFLTIITIIFIIINIDFNYVSNIILNYRELFKYFSSNIIPIILFGS